MTHCHAAGSHAINPPHDEA